MKACGTVFKYGDNIDTDVIIPARYLNSSDPKELAQHCMEDAIHSTVKFAENVKDGDIIVAEKNFGCGSSREQAPEIIKALKVKCVIAKSYARIFFRNSINNGLLLIENSDIQDVIKEGDSLTVNMGESLEFDGKTYPIHPLPDNLMDIINAGGLVKAMQKRNGII